MSMRVALIYAADACCRGAVAGVGLTRLLSYQILEAKHEGRLEVVLENYELPAWTISLRYAGQQLVPRKLRAFLDFAAPRLRDRLRAEAITFECRAS
ncbi:hypothetical protein LJR034_005295 [Caballeronia sp. LjRoot34]|uniref:hypothetical protein n=1 Tax=Caballeronia sp. LjRoot34 TaxID=3342325 RepID=UPI003ECD1625